MHFRGCQDSHHFKLIEGVSSLAEYCVYLSGNKSIKLILTPGDQSIIVIEAHCFKHQIYNVNLDVSNGAFTSLPLTRSYRYFGKEGIYFRWSSESDLEVGGGGVELHSNEIKFGAVGAVDASQYGSNNTHFKFYSFSGEDSMVVHFLTDVTVKYATNTGLTRSFVIREASSSGGGSSGLSDKPTYSN